MNEKSKIRDLELKEKYPKILRELGGDSRQTCMSWYHDGIAIGDGWIPLLENLFRFCQWHHDKNGYPQLVADQIKEKFGTLTFYHHFEDCDSDTAKYGEKFERDSDFIDGAVRFAETLSAIICENCGLPGKIRKTGWIYTACDACEKGYRDGKSDKKQMSLPGV